MKRIRAQIQKELTQILRDRLALILTIVLPLVLLLLLGKSISLTVTNLPIVIQDLDQSTLSRGYAESYRQSLTFRVISYPVDENPENALLTNRARAVVIIPEHFERDLQRGQNVDVQILVDATEVNTANITRGNAALITQAFTKNLRPQNSEKSITLKTETRLWFNPGREGGIFMGPGIFVLGLSVFMPLLAAIGLSREREQKTILQVYTSGISAHEYLIGKIAAYTILAVGQWIPSLIVLLFAFDLSFAGNPIPFLCGSLLFLICIQTFGAMIGSSIDKQGAAIQATSSITAISALFLSGLIFPVQNIPWAFHWVADISQARYFLEITARCFDSRRRLAIGVVCGADDWCHQCRILSDRLEPDQKNAD